MKTVSFGYARRRMHRSFDTNPFKYNYQLEKGEYVQNIPILYVGRRVKVIGAKAGETPHIFPIGSTVVCSEIMTDREDIPHARFCSEDGLDPFNNSDTLFKEEYEFL